MKSAALDLPTLVGTIPAWLALLLSIFSFVVARRSLIIAQEKEAKAKPNLYLYMQSGFFEISESGDRSYNFAVTISNRSDSNTSISLTELVLLLVTNEGWELRVRIPANEHSTLTSGLSLAPRQTLIGECRFFVAAELTRNAKFIAGHRFQVIDAAGETFELNPGSLLEVKS